jgi:hypothetical protein
MISNLIGAAIGRRIARRNEGGTGLILGALAPVIAKRAFGPLGLALAGGYVAKKAWDRRNRVRTTTTTTR